MADNHVLFSEVLSQLNRRETAWVRRVLGSGNQTNFAAEGIRLDAEEQEIWPDFQWQPQGRELWLYSEENGSPHHVAQFVKAFLRRFRTDECWQLSWSESCSRPRVGEFGGGGVFVTAQGSKLFHAHAWLEQQAAAFARRRHRGR